MLEFSFIDLQALLLANIEIFQNFQNSYSVEYLQEWFRVGKSGWLYRLGSSRFY